MALDGNLYGQDIIEEFLNLIVADIRDYMDGKILANKFGPRNATGKSKASIQVNKLTASTGQIVGAEYIEYVLRGRGPGKLPPLSKIVDWCNAKGIPRSRAWTIAKNIAEAGTQLHRDLKAMGVESIINLIVTPERIDTFVKSISALYVTGIQSEINKTLTS